MRTDSSLTCWAHNADGQAPALTLNPAVLPFGAIVQPYNQTLTANVGTAPFTFMLEAANLLPPGLSLSPAGQLSGSPTSGGTYSFIIGATDGNLIYGQRSYTLTVATPSPAITLNPQSLSKVMMGEAYSQTITAAGGTAPYTFSIVAGTLPAGLVLDPGGSLSGTPTASGTFDFTVGVIDSNDLFAQQAYSLTVKPSPLHLPIIINP